MRVQTIRNAILDQYGYKYTHTIKSSPKKVSEVVSMNNQPMQKTVLKDGKVRVFDMGLFKQWIERKSKI